MRWLILSYLIVNPLFFILGQDLRTAQELCYQTTSFILLISMLFFDTKPIKTDRVNMTIGIMGLWFMAVWMRYQAGFSIMLNLILGISVYMVVIKTLTKEDITFLAKGMAWVAGLSAVYLAFQYFGWDMRGQTMIGRAGGVPHCSFFGIKCAMGMYNAAILPLVLTLTPIGVLLLIPIALSYSSGAMLGAIVAIMFFYWYRKRIMFWILVPFILVGGVFFVMKMDMPTGMYTTRLPMWKMVIQDINKNPLGFGLDSFRNPTKNGMWRYYKYSFEGEKTVRVVKSDKGWQMTQQADAQFMDKVKNGMPPLDWWDSAHCDYIQTAYEAGLPALGIIAFLIYAVWQRFRSSMKDTKTVALTASLIAFGIFSMVQFPMHLARVGHLFPVLGGLFYLSTKED